MAAQSERSRPDNSPAKTRPIELLTENGFSIFRLWEIDGLPAPVDGTYPFLVCDPPGLNQERQVVVEIADEAVIRIELSSRCRILPGNSYWICYAERHLTTYVWENDDCPRDGKLRVEQLTPEDLDQATRWGRSERW